MKDKTRKRCVLKKYVAFLRGINIGGHNKIEMSKLKMVFESLGFKQISTYLNSGNVAFLSTSKSVRNISKKIENAILKNFNFPIRVLVVTSDKISYICKQVPESWKNKKSSEPYVVFLFEPIDTSPISHIKSVIHIEGVCIWNVRIKNWSIDTVYKFTNSPAVSKKVTVRSFRTIEKINGLLQTM